MSTKATTVLGICCVALGLFFGYPIGMLHMKWTIDADVRGLRAAATESAKAGKVCCDAAYVAIKYRPECPEVKP
jgi:hypothetical protein